MHSDEVQNKDTILSSYIIFFFSENWREWVSMGDIWNLIKINTKEIKDGELTIKTISAHEL